MVISKRKDELNESSKSSAKISGKKIGGNSAVTQLTNEDIESQYNMLQGIIDSADIPIFSVDRDCCYTSYNKRHTAVMKSIYGVDIQIGKNLLDYITVQADREKIRLNLDLVFSKGETVIEEAYSGDALLSRLYFAVIHNPIFNSDSEVDGVLVISRDITSRMDIEEKLQRQAHDLNERVKELTCLYRLSELIEEKDNSLSAIFDGLVATMPDAWQYPEITCARLSVENREFTTPNWQETDWKQLADIKVLGVVSGRLEICYLEQMPDSDEGPFLKGERNLINAIAERLGRVIELKQAEESILRSKLLLKTVIDSTPDFIYIKDLEHRYLLVNRSFALSQQLTPQDMIGMPDTDFFSEELCKGNPEKGIAGFHADDRQAFAGYLVQNPQNLVTWVDGSKHVYDTYEMPLYDTSGKIYGALVYGRDSMGQDKVINIEESTNNMSQRAAQSAISAIDMMVEMHDPNTAGHQRRVAALAGAIAREMKLDEERTEQLVMAAKIHDIGKISMPADILSKAGKLTDLEFSMIITHAQNSYDILWKTEFSQLVAIIVLQHHERLDGSGYPNGLKGDQMLIESKILAVADVVEAISSNRPYRPAFGIDRALEEIARNSGKLYDPEAVNVCLRLFNAKLFEFAE